MDTAGRCAAMHSSAGDKAMPCCSPAPWFECGCLHRCLFFGGGGGGRKGVENSVCLIFVVQKKSYLIPERTALTPFTIQYKAGAAGTPPATVAVLHCASRDTPVQCKG